MLTTIYSYIEYYFKNSHETDDTYNSFKKPDGYKNINSSSVRYHN